ncbi:DUF3231 family protein [Salirhabdus salicampi]|uniref:DUF3231 family protein n=1 Tax=Salirhabdus salicampi TaxID=476102 RepID=UPI0020C33D68|nr:DUF3231 family protein [Salirhabdus salicampi]MCP8615435.1 DUF3231 family protein [Salirhabdus salicampi]
MELNHKVRLTAPEIASLWTQYMYDSMSICFFRYALTHLEDEDTIHIYKRALSLAESHIESCKQFFHEEGFPIPTGFTEQDVNVKAPRLFQDPFYLYYIYIMTLHGLTGYNLSVGTSIRPDMRKYFIQCNEETMDLFDQAMNALLEKGLFTRPPSVQPPETTSFVDKQSFLTGWFGNRRPLTVMEIGDISFNMNKMHLHVALKVAFAQVTQSKTIKNIVERGIRISNKHTEIFKSIFNEEQLNSPISWQSLVTNSTTKTFSDKFIMYQIQFSTQAAVGFYGAALSVNSRRDLGAHYTRLTSELLAYAEDCANLMIKNRWLEQPPLASDRQSLAKKKKKS